MLRTIRSIVLPILVGLAVLALVGLAGSVLFLYREASAVHPALGWTVLATALAGLALLIVAPVARVVRLPAPLVRPGESSGPAWDRFVRRYAQRLARNPRIRSGFEGRERLETALRHSVPGSHESGASDVEAETISALRHLDGIARGIVVKHAAAVFAATAVSQSGRLDAAIVISAQLRMIREIAELYYQRPRPGELLRLYSNVGAATFIAGEIQDSEILAVLGAPVSAGLSGLIPVGGTDPLVSLLVNSLLDGSANAFLTLRVGAIARRYCGLRLEPDRRAISRSASLEAAGLLGGVVGQGAGRLATLTRRLAVESAVRGGSRAARGVAGIGSDLYERVAGMAERAGAAASGSAARGVRFLQDSLQFWEMVASRAGGSVAPGQGASAAGTADEPMDQGGA